MTQIRSFKLPNKNGKGMLTDKQIKNLKKQWGPDAVAKLMELAKEPYSLESLDEPISFLDNSESPILFKDTLADKNPLLKKLS